MGCIVSDFNPYREWLGIETTAKPTYYQLLGVSPRHAAADVVRQCAIARLKQLKAIDPGQHGELRDKLSQRVKRAAKCLGDAQERANYDRRLAAASQKSKPSEASGQSEQSGLLILDAQSQPTESEKAEGKSKETAPVLDVAPNISATPRSKRMVAKYRSRNAGWSVALIVGLVVLRFTLRTLTSTEPGKNFLRSLVPQSQELAGSTNPGMQTPIARPPVDPVANARDDDSATTASPSETSRSETTGQAPKPTPVKRDPEVPEGEIRQLNAMLAKARKAVEERDFERANEILEVSKRLARRQVDRAKHGRLELLAYYAGSYWQAVPEAMNALEAGNELIVKGKRMMVVENNEEHLMLRIAGQNRTYPKDDVPLSLEVALAERWFDADAPSTKVFRGAMMAVTPGFNPEEARVLWREAADAGYLKLEDLEPVLDDNYELLD